MTELQVTFGSLPVGTPFRRSVLARATTGDRRRKVYTRWPYIKNSHGSVAGFAKGPHGVWRSDHSWPVFIDVEQLDHRTLLAIVKANNQNGSALTEVIVGVLALGLLLLAIVFVFALLAM